MDGPDISAALADLPVPQRGDVPTMSKQEAVEVCSITYYIIWYIVCDMLLTGGIRAASKGRRQHCFHQEREYPNGLPKAQADECSGYEGSHPGSVII